MLLVAGTGDLTGAINGQNHTFVAQVTLTDDALVFVNGLSRLRSPAIENGYTLVGQTLSLAEAPVAGDTVWIYQPEGSGGEAVTNLMGPAPAPGTATAYRPALGNDIQPPEGSMTITPAIGRASGG